MSNRTATSEDKGDDKGDGRGGRGRGRGRGMGGDAEELVTLPSGPEAQV